MTTQPTSPPLPVARRLIDLVATLHHADPLALARARRVADIADANAWDDATATALVSQQLDWLAIFRHLGRTRGWTGTKIRSMAPGELLSALEK